LESPGVTIDSTYAKTISRRGLLKRHQFTSQTRNTGPILYLLSFTDLKYDGFCSTSTTRVTLAEVLSIALHTPPAALIQITLV